VLAKATRCAGHEHMLPGELCSEIHPSPPCPPLRG
jgi:hypothetical protein